jgi:hypothetical protein
MRQEKGRAVQYYTYYCGSTVSTEGVVLLMLPRPRGALGQRWGQLQDDMGTTTEVT